MADDLRSSMDSLSEQAGKIGIALYYTGGDMEKARQMVSGAMKDLYAVKSVFASTTMSGAFLIFFNRNTNKLLHFLSVVIPSYSTKKLDTSVDWRVFEKDIQDLIARGEHDEQLAKMLRAKFYDSFSLSFTAELSRFLEGNNIIAAERAFQKLIQFTLSLQRIDVKIDHQSISSLDMELYSSSSIKIDLTKVDSGKTAEAGPPGREEIAPGLGDVKLLLNAALILSPIKGKDIAKLEAGDRIKVVLTDRDKRAVDVAQALGAYEDGVFKPLTARLKTVEKAEAGFVFHGIIAKGVYVKIVEEETNIKIALDMAYELARPGAEAEKRSSLPLLLAIGAGFIILVVVILLLLLL